MPLHGGLLVGSAVFFAPHAPQSGIPFQTRIGMPRHLPEEIVQQTTRACATIERHLGNTVQAIHLFGSAMDGGLKPQSDIDLLVTARVAPDESVRRALLLDLLAVSAPPGDTSWRPLEVTVVAHGEVVPWRYPARRELQFGEWLRQDLLGGTFEPPMLDHDLAILLTKARQHSLALFGPPAQALFDPVPARDFAGALADTVAQWNSAEDWQGEERHIMLALARIWYSASTGRIAPKDSAADWLLERLPGEHRPILREARDVYRGLVVGDVPPDPERTEAFIRFAKANILPLLDRPGEGR